jgi:hypothetical protein
MSIRRFNYTERKKVDRSDVTISVQRRDGSLHFDARFDLSGYQLDEDGEVIVEAIKGLERLRFPWGTVSRPTPAVSRELRGFSSDDGLSFRLIVCRGVSRPDAGMILAEACNVRPELAIGDSAGGRSLLPVLVEPSLGQQLWRIQHLPSGPILQINAELGGKGWCATPEFRSAVLPSCVREVLVYILLVDMPEWPAMRPDEQSWQSLWLWFVCELPGVPAIPENRDSYENVLEWLDAATGAFARHIEAMQRWREARNEESER